MNDKVKDGSLRMFGAHDGHLEVIECPNRKLQSLQQQPRGRGTKCTDDEQERHIHISYPGNSVHSVCDPEQDPQAILTRA